MRHFRHDNTEGYTDAQLDSANAEMDRRIAESDYPDAFYERLGVVSDDGDAMGWYKNESESVLNKRRI